MTACGVGLKDASRRQGGGLRPSLTPTPHAVPGTYGRDEETASQPNQETDLAGGKRHTSRPPGEAEHYRKLVTHVPGLKCYPCGRLKTLDPHHAKRACARRAEPLGPDY
jgi:hypothetical protein